MIGPLLVTEYSGEPSIGCYSHYFGCQLSKPEPITSSWTNKLPQLISANFMVSLCFPQISWNTFWATRRWTSATKRRSWSSSRRLIRASGSASSRIRRRFRISWKAVRLQVLVRRRNTGKGFRRWRGSRTRSEFEAEEAFRSTTIPVSINLLQCIVVNFFFQIKNLFSCIFLWN